MIYLALRTTPAITCLAHQPLVRQPLVPRGEFRGISSAKLETLAPRTSSHADDDGVI